MDGGSGGQTLRQSDRRRYRPRGHGRDRHADGMQAERRRVLRLQFWRQRWKEGGQRKGLGAVLQEVVRRSQARDQLPAQTAALRLGPARPEAARRLTHEAATLAPPPPPRGTDLPQLRFRRRFRCLQHRPAGHERLDRAALRTATAAAAAAALTVSQRRAVSDRSRAAPTGTEEAPVSPQMPLVMLPRNLAAKDEKTSEFCTGITVR